MPYNLAKAASETSPIHGVVIRRRLKVEIKQFDTRLMDLAYMIRQCREKTKEVTRPYPDHVRRQADALESQMLNADMIIGGLIGILNESRIALSQSVEAANSKEGV